MSGKSLVIVWVGPGGPGYSTGPFASSFVNSQMKFVSALGDRIIPFVSERLDAPARFRREACRLKNLICREKPDLIHATYGSQTALLCRWTAVRAKVPFVISFCGSDLLDAPLAWWKGTRLRQRAGHLASRWSAQKAAGIIVKSPNLRERLQKKARRKSVIIPNGVDLSFFRIIDPAEARRMIGVPPAGECVLFNEGRMASGARIVKGYDLAQAAFRILQNRRPDVRLLSVGNIPHEEMPYNISAANVVLVASVYEGSPNIVKEAMACNTPIVSVRCGDVEERLRGVEPGEVVDRNPEAIAKGIERVLSQSGRSNGRFRLVSQGLAATEIAGKIRDFYREVLANPAVSWPHPH